jgi:hypothetical protein
MSSIVGFGAVSETLLGDEAAAKANTGGKTRVEKLFPFVWYIQ